MLESHSHGKDTGTDTTIVRYLITDDGSGSGIYDEPDVCFDSFYFDVGFISGE